jgi:hypothetical protein
MYLEISGRQTGKTSRLINQIYADKNKYDLQILMGINYNSLKQIKNNVKGNNKLKICLSYEAFQCEILGKNNVRLYVDEFLYSTAFCNNFLNFKSFHNIIQNGYFVSSINTDRYHIYSQLKELNNNLVNSMYTSSGDFL